VRGSAISKQHLSNRCFNVVVNFIGACFLGQNRSLTWQLLAFTSFYVFLNYIFPYLARSSKCWLNYMFCLYPCVPQLMVHYIVRDLPKTFLGNGLVNAFQRATMEAVSQWTNVIAHC
jgi:hypothetical protein